MGIAAELLSARNQQENEEKDSKQKENKDKFDESTNAAADKILDEGVLNGHVREVADAIAKEE